jgi:hypothetical protein
VTGAHPVRLYRPPSTRLGETFISPPGARKMAFQEYPLWHYIQRPIRRVVQTVCRHLVDVKSSSTLSAAGGDKNAFRSVISYAPTAALVVDGSRGGTTCRVAMAQDTVLVCGRGKGVKGVKAQSIKYRGPSPPPKSRSPFSLVPLLQRRQWSWHQDVTSPLNISRPGSRGLFERGGLCSVSSALK